jgi:hypothetical protein
MNRKLNVKVVKDAAAIIFFAVVVAFSVNLFNPKGFNFISKKVKLSGQIVELSVKEAKNRYDLKSALFIDSRKSRDYHKEHRSGAINIPALPISIAI